MSFRFRPQTVDALRRRSEQSGTGKGALAQRYVEEGLPAAQVEAALRYYAAHREEVDTWIRAEPCRRRPRAAHVAAA